MASNTSKKTRLLFLKGGILSSDRVIGSMLAVAAGIMPLIARVAVRPFSPELIPLFQSYYYVDVFSYWKGWFVIIPAGVIVILCVSGWTVQRRIPDLKGFFKKPPVIISLVYLVFVIISALSSPYTHTSWFGANHRSEGAFIWLAYFTVFFAAEYFVKEPRQAKLILYSLFFSSSIMSVIGVCQFIDWNFFNTDLARWLITVGTSAKGIGPAFENANGMLIHHNTFGLYSAMLTPVLLLGALAHNGKRFEILLLPVGFLMLICVFGSRSLGGLVGILAATVVVAGTHIFGVLYKKQKETTARRFFDKRVACMIGGFAGALALSIVLIAPINKSIALLFSRMENTIHGKTAVVQDYFFCGDTMFVYMGSDQQFSVTLNTQERLTIRDGKGQEVPSSRIQETSPQEDADYLTRYVFDVPGYGNVIIDRYLNYFEYYHSSRPLRLVLQDGRIFGIAINGGLIDLADGIPVWGFHGREAWGTHRGYIWSRSFPLLPSRTFIGSGPDTFASEFPQHDLVGKMRFFHDPYIVVDLSQNLFIHTWITTGGISALALIALFVHYLLTTFWSIVKTRGESAFSYRLRLGLLAGISAFCISSMSTDSTIASTGVFFLLLGLGYGMNTMLTKEHP